MMPLLVSILGKYGKVKTSDINCLHFIIHPIHHFIQYCPLLLLWSVTNKHFPLYPRVPCFFFPSGRSPPSHRLYLSRLRLFHLNPKNMCCKMVDSATQVSLARHRLKPSGLSNRGLPEQWVYVLHLPSTWHRTGLVAISGINKETKETALQSKCFVGWRLFGHLVRKSKFNMKVFFKLGEAF